MTTDRNRWLLGLALILAAALAATAMLVVRQRHAAPATAAAVAAARAASARIVAPTELPPVEPTAFRAIDPDDARAINAAVPFSAAPNPAARPFRLTSTPLDLARATDCLAIAVLDEAGDDPAGQRAVAQVVLNRLRHPAFPKTVCGVVFQGAERTTGCQFTFTCDGAMARTPLAPAFARARAVATAALAGTVDATVGQATHYHTDWVVPYWSASLDKIVAVHTHLFFRWSGWWGTPPAFRGGYAGDEPIVPALAPLSEAHRPSVDALAVASVDAVPVVPAPAADDESALRFTPTATNPDFFLVALPATIDPDHYPAIAARACGDRKSCVFMAWTDVRLVPHGLPAGTSQLESMAFHYLRDPVLTAPRTRWNCAGHRRADPQQCLSHQIGTL